MSGDLTAKENAMLTHIRNAVRDNGYPLHP